MSKAKILIVDDDPDFVSYCQTVLQSDGYEVACADSGDQGLRMLAQEKPDLVILDVIMSSVLDGLNMSQKMAENALYRHVPILMVTSIASTDYLALFPTDDNIHIDAFITKPIAPKELLRQVARFAAAAERQ
jgi:CheY-like chemotaxis protein